MGKHRSEIEILRDEFRKERKMNEQRYNRLLRWMVRTDEGVRFIVDKMDKRLVWEK